MAKRKRVNDMTYHYTYRITNIKEGMYYYGVHSCDCRPEEEIGVKYWSTSKRDGFVKHQKEHPEEYKYNVLKVFSTRVEAVQHEIFLHAKFDVKLHPKFYNEANQTSTNFDTTGKGNYIDENGKTILIPREEALLRGLKGESAGRTYSDEVKSRMGDSKKGSKRTDETKAKMSAWQKGLTLEERWGEEKAKEVKEKCSKARKGKTYEEIFGDDAERLRNLRKEQFSKPRERIDCEICGKNVTNNTLKRHQNGKKCIGKD